MPNEPADWAGHRPGSRAWIDHALGGRAENGALPEPRVLGGSHSCGGCLGSRHVNVGLTTVVMRPGLTPAEIRQLPAVVDLVTAGRALGLGRTTAYQLARDGAFPCRLIRIGRAYRVPTAELLALLGLSADPARSGHHDRKE